MTNQISTLHLQLLLKGVNKMKNALQTSHDLLGQLISLFPTGIFIDATLGKGRDAAFILSQENFQGRLFGFDIQNLALEKSMKHLEKFPQENYQLFLGSHDQIDQLLPVEDVPEIHGAVFNLGYLPGGDREITTEFETTSAALNQIKKRLVAGGQIILVIYSGHPAGAREKNLLISNLSKWSQTAFQVTSIDYLNQQNNPPSLLIVEKLRESLN